MILLAVGLRLALIGGGWPVLNSDEATLGLMARHIAAGVDFPAFLYGQAYMGALDAYLGAAFFHLIGPSLFALRLGVVVLFALFLGTMAALARTLYGWGNALASLAVLAFGSEEMLYRQLGVGGGFAEMLWLGSALLLLTAQLALTPSDGMSVRRRMLTYAAVGLAAGLGLWSDLLIVPFVLAAAALLLMFRRRELRGRAGALLVAGTLLGLAPALAYNTSVPLDHSTPAAVIGVYGAGGTGQVSGNATATEHAAATIGVSLPLVTGVSPLYSVLPESQWTPPGTTGRYLVPYMVWGLGVVLLWLLATITAVKAIVRSAVRDPLPWIQLAILASIALTVLLYLLSAAPVQSPRSSARYLTGLWVGVPALLAPLVGPRRDLATLPGCLLAVVRWLILAGITAVVAGGTVQQLVHGIPAVQQITRSQNALTRSLEQLGIRDVYSDYWTCNWLVFQSNERVLCAVLSDRLQLGNNRYRPYLRAVEHDRLAAYLFPPGSPQDRLLSQRGGCRREVFEGYALYQSCCREHVSKHPLSGGAYGAADCGDAGKDRHWSCLLRTVRVVLLFRQSCSTPPLQGLQRRLRQFEIWR